VLFSTGGAGLKADAFSSLEMSGLRSGIAAVALLLWMRRRLTVSPAIAAGALAYAATVTMFVAATKLTTAANAIFLQSAAPLYLVLAGPWLLDERLRRRDVPYLAAVGVGMWLAFAGSAGASQTAPQPLLGNVIAVACGLTWAATLLALRLVARDARTSDAALSVVSFGNVLAAAVALPALWPLPSASGGEWLTVLYLGLGQVALAYVFLTAAVRRLPAVEVSLLLLLEPVLNPLWTWLVRGEEPGAAVVTGGAVILSATAGRALFLSFEPVPALRSGPHP
jgi:drug/metabolite transporter (DMT)-like permease